MVDVIEDYYYVNGIMHYIATRTNVFKNWLEIGKGLYTLMLGRKENRTYSDMYMQKIKI